MSETIAHNLEEKSRTEDILVNESYNFDSLLLSTSTARGLKDAGFYKPSPIQLKAIPLGRCGLDLIVKAKSGTGKTAVFTIIALEMLKVSKNALQVLIFAPTREIAVQIEDVIKTIGKELKDLKVASFIGGLPLENDIEKAKGCHVAVGAPGRLKHLVEKGYLDVKTVRLLVLDEADKLMEECFQNDINCIYSKLPERKQVIALSATYTDELKTFLERYMQSPTFVTPEVDNPVLLGLRQFVTVVDASANVVQQMKTKTEELIRLLSSITFTQCLVFCNFQQRTESISNTLNNKGWNSMHISAAQTQAERLKTYDSLKKFKCRILLSTDLTARGIDASNIDLVINYDVPYETATYLHRMGRAGRYGSQGLCITIAADGKELQNLQSILGEIGGTKLSIARMPKGENVDNIWECDVNTFESIFGVVDNNLAKNAESKKQDLKKSIFEMKNKKKDKSEADSVSSDLKRLTVDENNASGIEEVYGLEADSVEDDNEKMKKIREKYSEIDSESLLKSLAAGKGLETLENNQEDNTTEKDEAATSEAQNVSPSVESKVKEIISPALLYPWVLVDVPVLSRPANKKNLLVSPGSSPNSNGEVSDVEKKKKKKKRNKKVAPNDNTETKKLDEDLVYHKNVALYNVSKLLTNEDLDNDESSVVQPIGDYLKLVEEKHQVKLQKLKKLYKKYNTEELLEEVTETSERDPSLKVDESKPLNRDDPQENIFRLAFDMHHKDGIHWIDALGDKYVEPESEEEEESDDHDDEEEEEEGMEFEENEEIYEEAASNSPPNNTNQNDVKKPNKPAGYKFVNQPPRYDFVNQQAACSRATNHASARRGAGNPGAFTRYANMHPQRIDKFASYFEYYRQVIACNALTFENVPSFDNWFLYWQRQVVSVRDYVQQNIYIQEMNNYRYNRRNYSYNNRQN